MGLCKMLAKREALDSSVSYPPGGETPAVELTVGGRAMHKRNAWILCFLLLLGCGSPEPETIDAHVTFSIIGGKPSSDAAVTSEEAVAFLAVEKDGRTPIVNTWQEGAGEGRQYGRHRLPCAPRAD